MPGQGSVMKAALWLVGAASLLAPAALRPEWRREWEAEIHSALRIMRERGEAPSAIRRRLLRFARGAFVDALWHSREAWSRERIATTAADNTRSARFCLASLAGLVLFIVAVSGFLPRTRATLLPLPYREPGRIATVSRARSMAQNTGISPPIVALWRSQSRLMEDTATYYWNGRSSTEARVSSNFFYLLGARTLNGRRFERNDLANCRPCAVVSYDFWRRSGARGSVSSGGREYRISAVLQRGFWFLSPKIAVWTMDLAAEDAPRQTGVVVRMQPEVKEREVARELESILSDSGFSPWESLVDVSPVGGSVRSVYGSFAFGVGLAVVVVAASLRSRLPRWDSRQRGWMPVLSRGAFFAAKTLLALLAVLLCGLEFTPAASLSMLGGMDMAAGFVATWLFLLGSMGVFCWSILDQRRRCRVCLRRLGLAAHVGCPGCLLLDWAGTELVCVEGHGMLHIADMAVCWRETERWTWLDESWQGLFTTGRGA